MAKKKSSAKKKKVANRKRVYAKKAAKRKLVAKKGPAAKKKLVAKKKSSARGPRHARSSRAGVEKKGARRRKSTAKGRQETTFPVRGAGRRGLDSTSAGQSGDTQGLSRREDQDSESVTELAEEGQYFEAEAVSGVEDAKDPDQGEVRTREVPEDDVPPEYTDQD